MRRVQIVSTPALLEARNLARWIARERVPGVRIAPSKGEWGVFAPAQYAERARRAFRRAVAANNPGGHRVYFKVRLQDKYRPVRKLLTFGRATALADKLVKGLAVKAAVLDRRGKVRFVAFKRNANGRALTNSPMDKLADAAVVMAARGAREYLDRHKLTADQGTLTESLKAKVKAAFPKALDDVRDAIQAGMPQIAEATFMASMRLAGIDAAKEAGKPSAATNPRGLVPMEVKGSTQAARLLKYLRKQGVRAKLRHVAGRPGWFGFTCPLSQEEKSERLCMKWSTLSEGIDRPTDKALAAEKRWRIRQRRRKHRRGYRKGGYFMGGRTLPLDRPLPNRRQARRNAPYYYTPKYRPPMVGNVPPGFTLVEAPQIGRWRQDLPVSRYRYGVISYPHALSDQDMTRYELDYATPRTGTNPVRASRNARSKSRRNIPIETKWTTMTERQRIEALRIVGIDRDVADVWGYKTWDQLSSVVKTLLLRAWKRGGDTTKIRRAPVGAR